MEKLIECCLELLVTEKRKLRSEPSTIVLFSGAAVTSIFGRVFAKLLPGQNGQGQQDHRQLFMTLNALHITP